MPPKKRKVDDGNNSSDGGTPKKKSRTEAKVEAKAKAKAWHDARVAAKSKSSLVTSSAMMAAGASSPSFSVGSATSKSTTSTAATRKRATPIRKKSTGTTAVASPASMSSVSSKSSALAARKSRASSAKSTAMSAAMEEEEDNDDDDETLEAATITTMTGGSDDGSTEEGRLKSTKSKSTKERKRGQGLAAIRALQEERMATKQQRKSPPPRNTATASPNYSFDVLSPQLSVTASSVIASASASMASASPLSSSIPMMQQQKQKLALKKRHAEEDQMAQTTLRRDGVGAVDPDGSHEDISTATKPCPPGRNEVQSKPSPPALNRNENHDDAGPPTMSVEAETGLLHTAISRAKAIVSSATETVISQQQRMLMGIRSSQTNTEASSVSMQDDGRNSGVRGRTMDRIASVNADRFRDKSVDPPSIPYSVTLQKLRVSGSATKSVPVSRSKNDSTNVVTSTVAGENTSEVGAPASLATTTLSESSNAFTILKKSLIGFGALIMFVELGIGFWYLCSTSSASIGTNISTTSSIMPELEFVSCFMDYPISDTPADDSEQTLYDEAKCEGKHQQCPQWGQCRGGKLFNCTDDVMTLAGRNLFVPSEKGDSCVVGPQTKKLVETVNDTLVGMTADYFCGTMVNGVLLQNETFPLFSLEEVVAKLQNIQGEGFTSDLLIWLFPAFNSDSVRFGSLIGNDNDILDGIGLGDIVSPDSLPFTFSCKMKLYCREMFDYFTHSVLALVKYLATIALFIVWQYPLYSFSVMGFAYVARIVQRRRRHNAKVRELFGIVREAAYDRLCECDDDTGYAALLLRDDVGHYMYPTSFVKRQFMNDYVWPRVVLEIRGDNRVRKFRKMNAGKELEHWDFAVQSKKGWRLRKSLGGTPIGTPGSKPEHDVSPKRDP